MTDERLHRHPHFHIGPHGYYLGSVLLTHWLTYRALAVSLDVRLAGARVAGAFSQTKDELIVFLSRNGEDFFLRFSAEPRTPNLAIWPSFNRARRNSVDLFPGLESAEVASVRIARDDRVIRIAFDNGSALLFTFLPNGANAVRVSPDGKVLDSFKKSGNPKTGDNEFDNALPDIQPGEIDAAVSAHQDEPAATALKRVRPFLAGTFARELFHRLGLPTDTPCANVDASKIATALGSMLEESGKGECFMYLEDERPVAFAPLRLTHLDGTGEEHFGDVTEGLLFFLRRRFKTTGFADRKRIMEKALTRSLEKIGRSLANVAPPEELLSRADEYEKSGNLLMIHLHHAPEQPGRMTVPDIFTDPRIVISIPVDERLTVMQNAQRYFDRARNSRAAADVARERAVSLGRTRERLLRMRADLDAATDADELNQLMKTHHDLLETLGMTEKGERQERPFPFRRFTVAGGFEVWAGKSGANNDELTVRHAKPNDLWFHARGVGGSHVVLKTGSSEGTPGKEAIRQAASIAAYYSKHRKARSVPVAYTEKKYVRKPKGVPPGTVVLEREKVIMVEPKLPESASPDDDRDE